MNVRKYRVRSYISSKYLSNSATVGCSKEAFRLLKAVGFEFLNDEYECKTVGSVFYLYENRAATLDYGARSIPQVQSDKFVEEMRPIVRYYYPSWAIMVLSVILLAFSYSFPILGIPVAMFMTLILYSRLSVRFRLAIILGILDKPKEYRWFYPILYGVELLINSNLRKIFSKKLKEAPWNQQ